MRASEQVRTAACAALLFSLNAYVIAWRWPAGAVDTGGDLMTKTFGFDEDELKLLLVAVRQMRRTFAAARKTAPEPQPAVDAYAGLYDDLYAKLLDMAGPLPATIEDLLEK